MHTRKILKVVCLNKMVWGGLYAYISEKADWGGVYASEHVEIAVYAMSFLCQGNCVLQAAARSTTRHIMEDSKCDSATPPKKGYVVRSFNRRKI
jgi:hypothetical protein